MKVIQNFVLIIILQHEINEKPCWTSQILGEKSWKNVTCFCCEFCFRRRRRGADDQCIKTNNKMSHFFKIFLQGFVKFSKVFHWFHVAKCYSEEHYEELSWKKLTPKLFRKLSYYTFILLCHLSWDSVCILVWPNGHRSVFNDARAL